MGCGRVEGRRRGSWGRDRRPRDPQGTDWGAAGRSFRMRVDLKKMRPGGLTRCIMRAGPEKQLKPCRLLEREK